MAVSPEDFTQRPGCPVLRPPSKEVHLVQKGSWLCCFQLKLSIVLALSLESGIESFVWEYRGIKFQHSVVNVLLFTSVHLVLLLLYLDHMCWFMCDFTDTRLFLLI